MNTDDLIASLAADPAPAPDARPERALPLALLAGGAVALVMFFLAWGPRPDLGAALSSPVTLAKTLLPLALAALALPLALRSARPGAPLGAPRRLIWIVPGIAAALLLGAFLATAPGQRLVLFLGHSIPVCLPSIVLLSLPILAGLIRALRRGAPVHPAACGALAGLAAAGLATTLYSLFCIEDSPLFYAVWYSSGILLAAGAGALAGARWLRW